MVIAGLCGGLDRAGENRFGVTHYAFHDAACVLLRDGEVAAAIEEERLNRIKHTNTSPLLALRFCLERRGLTIGDVDAFAFGVRERYVDEVLDERYRVARSLGRQRAHRVLQDMLADEFGTRIDPARFAFVDHHFAHACSAYYPSGFDRALVFTIDGVGDGLSGSMSIASGSDIQLLRTWPEEDSLGHFYVHVCRYLGFDLFDEYKVMGLAPYGDGARFAREFSALYELLPDGSYRFHRERLRGLWNQLPRRTPGAEPTQSDQDVAMAAQLTLQRIVTHVLTYYQQLTGLDRLCLAGGVALNCKMNGELLRSGLFRRIFVQPAAHDAGLALGAALSVQRQRAPLAIPVCSPVRHVYWGGECGSPRAIEALLERWRAFIVAERVEDPYAAGAQALADGAILGWARGRSEFGPRALGNRSILADPRPAANKDIINALVKKREAFRPFAPSVLEEHAAEVFDLPDGEPAFPFMLFTVPVRERYRATLGAITHVDGSARLQTVSRRDNPCYWRLIDSFRELTGIPLLLNTSFNNYAEPIVETAADCLVCFLTTGLPTLIIENWMITKRPRQPEALLDLILRQPASTKLHDRPATLDRIVAPPPAPATRPWWRIWPRRRASTPIAVARAPGRVVGTTFAPRELPVSDEVCTLLLASDGYQTVGELLDRAAVRDEAARRACLETIDQLWERRLVSLAPAAAGRAS